MSFLNRFVNVHYEKQIGNISEFTVVIMVILWDTLLSLFSLDKH